MGMSGTTILSVGTVAAPQMEKLGYDRKFSLGALLSGGVLGPLIPPSIPFIVYAILSQQSIGQIFIAGIIPGIVLTIMLSAYATLACMIRPELAPRPTGVSWKERLFFSQEGLACNRPYTWNTRRDLLWSGDRYRGRRSRSSYYPAYSCCVLSVSSAQFSRGSVTGGNTDGHDWHYGYCHYSLHLCGGSFRAGTGSKQFYRVFRVIPVVGNNQHKTRYSCSRMHDGRARHSYGDYASLYPAG